ncbi:MAG: tRNA (adenosine(37)-N6)-threonylcarbamoyltransferase complex dimerization subunit type 1 TsaB [Candidatus Bipolaricaulota bacterium]|nr:tRNA (adenosine(37)-N6)-threonylcarbamoyltransferase complex dimerization subunit type 1 TsaB [Candidatus Bipolaricaulota bacterium]
MILGIETAGRRGGVALVSPAGEVELLLPPGPQGTALLPAGANALLTLVGAERVDAVAVDIGPGSFTGLRVGVAFAKGLAQAWGVPVVGVRQTEVLARAVLPWPGRIAVWIHDRREFVYAAWATPDRVGRETVLPWEEALRRALERGASLLVGSGALEFRDEIRARAPELRVAPEALAHPRPGTVARLGWERFKAGGGEDPRGLEPHYGHKEE